MNRTASHETLSSLLLHTDDPLPLVLALDDMDPDDPTTGVIGRLIEGEALRKLRFILTDAVKKERRYGRPLSTEERNLLHETWIRTPNPTPDQLLQTIQRYTNSAEAHGGRITISPHTRQLMSSHLEGDTSFGISGPEPYQGETSFTWWIHTSPRNQAQLSLIADQLRPHCTSRRPPTQISYSPAATHSTPKRPALFFELQPTSYEAARSLIQETVRRLNPEATIFINPKSNLFSS